MRLRRPTLARSARRPLGLLALVALLLAAPVAAGAAPRSPDPFAGARLWVDPTSMAAQQAAALATSDPADAAQLGKIAGQPQAVWFGDWVATSRVQAQAASLVRTVRAAGALPVLVVYDIPHRDCGGFSAGGAPDAAAYRAWVSAFAAGLGDGPTAVVLEPDALTHLTICGFSAGQRKERLGLLAWATARLSRRPGTAVYLDAGSSGWHSAAQMARVLRSAGVAKARGFALDVADFKAQPAVLGFGRQVSTVLGGEPFVVDTSRNGHGAPRGTGLALWCNPPGRALGLRPTVRTGVPGVDAYLWVKRPGESDGECGRGDPPAGAWMTSYAVGLAQGSAW